MKFATNFQRAIVKSITCICVDRVIVEMVRRPGGSVYAVD